MKSTMKIEGLRELDKALGDLPKNTGKNVLRRVGRKALKPFADDMRAKAPRDQGDLQEGIGVGTKLTRRQRAMHRKMFRDDKASVELFAGAGGHPQAVQQEFGNENHSAQPFGRPAWDANADKVLGIIVDDLGDEIMKAAKRLARKQARLAAKG